LDITRGTLNAVYVLIYFHLKPAAHVADLHTLSVTLDVPQSYLSKVLQQLHRAGYLVSQMGSKGGYRLSRPVEKVTMKEVLHAMQGDPLMQECLSDHFNCGRFKKCSVLGHVQQIQMAVNQMLDKLTIGQLAMEMEFQERQQKALGQINVLGVQ
jgi:Rrf2 family protein